MAKRSDPMADALGHHFGEPGGKALGNFRSPEPADIPDETEAPAATPLPALRPLSDQGDTDYGDATYQARANTRAGMRALQVRQLLAVHEGMRTRARENGIAVQEFLSRLVLGELARPLPQRARRRRLPQHSGRMGTRVAQVYLRDDIHKAFKLRATEYEMSQQALLARLILARMERTGVPRRQALPPLTNDR